MKRITRCVVGIAAAATFGLSAALADQVTVADCTGNTRLVKEIQSGKENLLTLSFEKMELGAFPEAVLKNVASGQKMTSTKATNSLQFKNISSGQWQYCTSDGQMLAASDVTLMELTGQEALTDATSIIGGGALVGLGTLAAFSLGGGGGSDAAAPATASRGPSAAGASNVAGSASRPITSQSTGVCFIGEDTEVVPVSPFS